MNYVKKYIFSFIIFAIYFIALFSFKTLPVSKLWNGYSAVYVPIKTESKLVLSILENAGCKDIISFDKQEIPFYSEFLPISFLDKFNYIENRKLYFFDKGKNVMIYYIPDEYNKNASAAVSILNNKYSIDAGLDCKSSFPVLIPIISFIVFFLFFIFSKNKLIYFCSSIFSLFFIFAMPFYLNASCVSFYFYLCFLCQKYWRRKNAIDCLIKKLGFIILLLLILSFSFFSSILSGILFIFSIVCSYLAIKMVYLIQIEIESKIRFNPVLIIPSNHIKLLRAKDLKKSIVNIISSGIFIIFYIFSANLFIISNAEDLFFPMPTSYNKEKENVNIIPNLDNYLIWSWNTITLPFRSLNESYSIVPQEGETIKIQRFENTSQGIKTFDEVLYCYDDTFKENVINYIDELDYPAVEKLMKKQNKGFEIKYSKGLAEKFKKSNIILMLVIFLIPFLMAVNYLIGRKKDDEII